MEIKEVVFTGLGRAVSDLDCKDGELSVSHNIINDGGVMRPIAVPEASMELMDGEKLIYIHRTSEYSNYIVSGRIRVKNQITVYHKYGEYPDNYLRLVVVLQYPAASQLKVYMKCLIGGSEQELIITFPEGTSGKQVLSMGEQDTFIEARYEAQDSHYNYRLTTVDDSSDASDDAEWSDTAPEFAYGLNFFTDEDSVRKEVIELPSAETDVKLTSIGNTLVLTGENGLEYILFKDGVYRPLGQKPPFCSISFGLRCGTYNETVYDRYGEMIQDWGTETGNFFGTEFFDLLENYLSSGKLARELDYSGYYEQWEQEVDPEFTAQAVKFVDMMTNKAQELVNEEIQEKKNKNAFAQSFFIRYAYRMYDGTHYMHSAPIFVPMNVAKPVLVPISVHDVDAYNKKVVVGLRMIGGTLDYRVVGFYNNGVKVDDELINEWSDVIDGLDVFVTSPINSFKTDGHVWGFSDKSELYAEATSSISGTTDMIGNAVDFYRKSYTEQYRSDVTFTFDDLDENDTLVDRIKNASLFYKIAEFKKVEDLVSELNLPMRSVLPMEKDVLKNLEQNERLEDDFESNDFLFAENAVIYNERLTLSGVKQRMFNGYPLESMVIYSYKSDDTNKDWEVRTNIKKESGDCSLVAKGNVKLYENPAYLFYPSIKVDSFDVRMYASITDDSGTTIKLDFMQSFEAEEHKFLNGSLYLSPTYGAEDIYSSSFGSLEESGNPFVNKPNMLYTSEVNNPYYFPLGGMNTIGTGEIKGIASVTKALSQGQFGQFPLYVFSTEGVWAMEVGTNGLWSSVKPVSRDVCINGNSITQIDDAVLFVSEKGVMRVDGSEVSCISEMMDGRSFDPEDVESLTTVMDMCDIASALKGKQDFMDYVRECSMAYDYGNSRVVLYNAEKEYCYVYSLKMGTWATLGLNVETAVTDYPNVYVQTGYDVVELSKKTDYDNVSRIVTLMVTRPVKLDDDGYKTVYEMVVRGAMDRRRGAVLLWASHDGLTYNLICDAERNRIYRTGGSGYRYYRIGVVGDMTVGETVTCASVKFRRKYGNRLR